MKCLDERKSSFNNRVIGKRVENAARISEYEKAEKAGQKNYRIDKGVTASFTCGNGNALRPLSGRSRGFRERHSPRNAAL